MVFQNVYLFHDSIENNIKFGKPDATHEEVEAAAQRACCHDFISALPDGYNTITVSYTNLDVYKRQPMEVWMFSQYASPANQRLAGQPMMPRQKQA